MKTRFNTRLDFTVFFCGAGTLELEILASRFMVPSFGTSIYIWGAVLSVTLMYLAIGYRWGGKVAGRISNHSQRLALHILLSSAWIGLIFAFGPPLLQFGLKLGAMMGPILVSLVLLGPPLVLLSTAVPLGIGIVDARQKGATKASVIAGNLFALSTVGSIFGALITAYWFLPQWGVGQSFIVVSIILLLLTIPNFTDKRVLQAAVCAIFLVGISRVLTSSPELKSGLEFLDRKATPYGQVDVIADHRDNSRILMIDGASQNHVTGPGWRESKFKYIDVIKNKARRLKIIARMVSSEQSKKDTFLGFQLDNKDNQKSPEHMPNSALVLGLGAGTLPRALLQAGYQVDSVENDPIILDMAENYFSFKQSDKMVVHLEGARTFITNAMQNQKRWDLIVVDLFGGGTMPGHMYTKEAYQMMYSLLKPNGILAINFISHVAPPNNKTVMHSAATLTHLFRNVSLYSVYPDAVAKGEMGQALIFATDSPYQKQLYSDVEREENLIKFDRNLRALTDDWNPINNWSVVSNAEWHHNIVDWLGPGVLVPH